MCVQGPGVRCFCALLVPMLMCCAGAATLKPERSTLACTAGIYAMSFDVTGSRLVTCEADKTIKMWKEDETATPESHPVIFKPPSAIKRF